MEQRARTRAILREQISSLPRERREIFKRFLEIEEELDRLLAEKETLPPDEYDRRRAALLEERRIVIEQDRAITEGKNTKRKRSSPSSLLGPSASSSATPSPEASVPPLATTTEPPSSTTSPEEAIAEERAMLLEALRSPDPAVHQAAKARFRQRIEEIRREEREAKRRSRYDSAPDGGRH